MEYNIILSRDHILIDSADGILLVDTGSPMSFHENGMIRLGDEEFQVPTSLMGVDASYIADKVGERVSGLLGMDIISRLIQLRYRHISIGRLILQVDMVVVAASMLVFKNIEVGLYAMMTIFTSTKIVDSVLFGLYTGKLVLIVSGKNREICREITEKLGRGATFLRGEGGYSGEEKQVLLCAIRPPEYHRMQEIVRKIDPDGFVITVQASEILGQGFSPIREESVK